MIRREKEIRQRRVENAMGGEGYVIFQDWLLPEEAPGHGRVFSRIIIPAGCSIGYHAHKGEFEAYQVAAGRGRLNQNGEELILETGDMHLCPSGEAHGIANDGPEDLVLQALILNDLS